MGLKMKMMILTVFSPTNPVLISFRPASLVAGLVCLLTAAIMPVSGSFADERIETAETHIQKMIKEVRLKSGAQLSETEKQELFYHVISSYFDVDGIVRYTAGRYWRAATAEQRKTYKEVFLDILTASAASQFGALMELDFVPSASVARGDKLILVKGQITDRTGEIPDAAIAWRVALVKDKPPRIIDIEVENISMLKTQQDENTAIIRKNGGKFSALIDELKQRQKTLNSTE